jgi:hypothetical protein
VKIESGEEKRMEEKDIDKWRYSKAKRVRKKR